MKKKYTTANNVQVIAVSATKIQAILTKFFLIAILMSFAAISFLHAADMQKEQIKHYSIVKSKADKIKLTKEAKEVKAFLNGFFSKRGNHIQILSSQKIPQIDATMYYFAIKSLDGKILHEDIVFAKNNIIIPDLVDMKTKRSIKQEILQRVAEQNMVPVLLKESKKNMVILKSDNPRNPTLFVLSDPNCPYCRAELKNINKALKHYTIKLIFTPLPMHGYTALKKAAIIMDKINALKNPTNKQKIQILQKYFDPKTDVAAVKISNKKILAIKNNARKYKELGLNGVPMKILIKSTKRK